MATGDALRLDRIATLVLIVAAAPSSVVAQSAWDRYQPGTLSAIVERHRSTVEAGADSMPRFHVSTQTFPTRAELVFTGETRPIGADSRQVLRMWAMTMLRDSTRVSVYEEEWQFREGSLTLWLPVQNETAESMRGVARPQMPVTVWAQWFGAARRAGTITWVFPVMMTQTHEPDAP